MTFVIAFVDSVMNNCKKLITYFHTSDFNLLKLMKTFCGKVKEQRGQIKKNNGFFIAH